MRAVLEEDEAEPRGQNDGLGAGLRPELPENRIYVELGGVLADPEPLGDPAVRKALGEELKDLRLAVRELLGEARSRIGDGRQDPLSQGLVQDQEPLGGRPEARGEAGRLDVAEQRAPDPSAQCIVDTGVPREERHDRNGKTPEAVGKGARTASEVPQGHVGQRFLDERGHVLAGRLPHDREVLVPREEEAQSLTGERILADDQDAEHVLSIRRFHPFPIPRRPWSTISKGIDRQEKAPGL
jgi:hypothetical protein